MIVPLMLVSLLGLQTTAPKAVALPDTPQGRQVEAYIKGFNSGDEKAFLAANEKTMTPELLAKRPAEERAKLFQRMRSDFAAIKVARLVKATPAQIVFVALLKDGNEGTFTLRLRGEVALQNLAARNRRRSARAPLTPVKGAARSGQVVCAGMLRYQSTVRLSPSSNGTIGL